MRFQRSSLGRALSGVATVLLLGGCGLGADSPAGTAEATPLYPGPPAVAWRLTNEDAGLAAKDPVLTDPGAIYPTSEWALPADVIDLGDLWLAAARTRSGTGEHRLLGISPDVGTVTWSYAPDEGDLLGCTNQLVDGLLACGVSVGVEDPWTPTGVVLLDPATGEVISALPLPPGTRQWHATGDAIIAVVGAVTMGAGGERTAPTTLVRLTLTGEVVWSADLASEAPRYMDECGEWLGADGETVTYDNCGNLWFVRLSDGVVLLNGGDGAAVAISGDSALVAEYTDDGSAGFRVLQGAEVLAEFDGYEQVRSLLEVPDSPVVLRGPRGDVLELDLRTGHTTSTGIVAGALDSFDRVGSRLVVGASGSLYLHDAARPGTVLWSQRYLRGGPSDPVTDEAAMYMLDDQSEPDLVALRLADGAVLWEVAAAQLAPPDGEGEPPSVRFIRDRLVLADGAAITVLEPGTAAPGAESSGAEPADRVPPSALGVGSSLVAWGSDQNGEGGLPGVTAEPAIQLAAGSYHSLAVRSDGTVAAWGWNGNGQRAVPRAVQRAVAVAGGGFHSLALLEDGTVAAWGNDPAAEVPRRLDDVVQVSAGEEHSLALREDGTVVAWGDDGYGQGSVPAEVTDVVEVSAGGYHNLALREDGTVIGWGFDGSGRATPPEGLSGVAAISAGRYHNLALREDGTVVAWGKNRFGRTDVPAGLTGVTAVAAGDSHNLALREDGTVVAWGYNGYGETDVPPGLRGVVAIAAGAYHSLALTADGRIVTWGRDLEGQATLPTPLTDAVAVSCAPDQCLALTGSGSVRRWGSTWAEQYGAVPALSDAVAVAAGWNHGVALRADGSVTAWGADYQGQATPPESLPAVTAISAGEDYSLAVTAEGGVVFWGASHLEVAAVPPDLRGVVSVSAGQGHALALRSDGTVVAWGRCSSGQCEVPADLDNVVAVAAGADHSVALRSDGTVVAWGANHAGATTVPEGLGDVVAIAAGYEHTLALRADGTVVAWGGDTDGQASVPDGLAGVVAIAAGGWHSLAAVGGG